MFGFCHAVVVAGGMNKRGGTGRSLSDRVSDGQDHGPDFEHLRRRHCWVVGVDPADGPWPGLVAEWRRGAAGWEARVVYAMQDLTRTVEEWVPAARLRPGNWPD